MDIVVLGHLDVCIGYKTGFHLYKYNIVSSKRVQVSKTLVFDGHNLQ